LGEHKAEGKKDFKNLLFQENTDAGKSETENIQTCFCIYFFEAFLGTGVRFMLL